MGILDILEKVLRAAESNYSQSVAKTNRTISEKERQVKSAQRSGKISAKQAQEQLNKLENVRSKINYGEGFHRTTDEELSRDESWKSKNPRDYSYKSRVPLENAISSAPSEPGVYVIMLNGSVMKCGRASYSGGVRWRLRQYYNLKYDKKSQSGNHWSITESNRDSVIVSWQCCPASQCHELEYKLFKKYGKGAWAERAPATCYTNNWELLI